MINTIKKFFTKKLITSNPPAYEIAKVASDKRLKKQKDTLRNTFYRMLNDHINSGYFSMDYEFNYIAHHVGHSEEETAYIEFAEELKKNGFRYTITEPPVNVYMRMIDGVMYYPVDRMSEYQSGQVPRKILSIYWDK
jgi:hypothetical protein